MTHDNPGEDPFRSRFRSPAEARSYGVNGRILRNLNLLVDWTPEEDDPLELPAVPRDVAEWQGLRLGGARGELAGLEAAGLVRLAHIDPLLFPIYVIEAFPEALDSTGRIDFASKTTQSLLSMMLDRIFRQFANLDGLVVRLGETYTIGAPHHRGDNPVRYSLEESLTFTDGALDPSGSIDASALADEQNSFRAVIAFLRREVCVRNERILVVRTWDMFGDRLHSSPSYYTAVTDTIETHPKLFFSMKHTQRDFLRFVPENPTIGVGAHKQIVEVQLQREYEAKASVPNLIATMVLDGFPEIPSKGLRRHTHNPLVAGLMTWTRGGGWFGPYPGSELWPAVNLRIISGWVHDHQRSTRDLVADALTDEGFCHTDVPYVLEQMDAIDRAMRLVRYADGLLPPLWTRDDRIGGLAQLAPTLAESSGRDMILTRIGQGRRSLDSLDADAREAVVAHGLHNRGKVPPARTASGSALHQLFVDTGYAFSWFSLLAASVHLCVAVVRAECDRDTAGAAISELASRAIEWDEAWTAHVAYCDRTPATATAYRDVYWDWPGSAGSPGIGATRAQAKKILDSSSIQT